jgi:hypothetical protein
MKIAGCDFEQGKSLVDIFNPRNLYVMDWNHGWFY